MLVSSTDPLEAGRVLSYLMKGDSTYLTRYLKEHTLPTGTVVPKEILVQAMRQSSKENRLKVIENLPSIVPSSAPVPPLPAKLTGRRRQH